VRFHDTLDAEPGNALPFDHRRSACPSPGAGRFDEAETCYRAALRIAEAEIDIA
jgi:hypothetical protein